MLFRIHRVFVSFLHKRGRAKWGHEVRLRIAVHGWPCAAKPRLPAMAETA